MLCFAGLPDMGRVQTAAEMTRAAHISLPASSWPVAQAWPGKAICPPGAEQGHLSLKSSSKAICPQKQQQQQHRVLCSPSFGSIPGWMHTRVQIHGGLALTNEGDNQNKDLRPQTLLSKGYGMLSQDFENIFAIASWTGITVRTACMKKEG